MSGRGLACGSWGGHKWDKESRRVKAERRGRGGFGHGRPVEAVGRASAGLCQAMTFGGAEQPIVADLLKAFGMTCARGDDEFVVGSVQIL